MSNPGPLFRPFEKLVKIVIAGKEFEVPEGNMLLRAFQYLSPEDVAHGRFCWNEECQYCRVHFDLGPDTADRVALSCKLMVQSQGLPLSFTRAGLVIVCRVGEGHGGAPVTRCEGREPVWVRPSDPATGCGGG